jgi:hypothetical protein
MFNCKRKNRGSRQKSDGRGEDVSHDPKRTENLISFAEKSLGISGEQREAWDRLAETLRDSADAMHTARAAVYDGEEEAIARYALLENFADVASGALRRIRPQFEGLYGVLDESQRRTFDELITHGAQNR